MVAVSVTVSVAVSVAASFAVSVAVEVIIVMGVGTIFLFGYVKTAVTLSRLLQES